MIKIIAGKFKGINLDVPKSARATLSRARQSIFDVLEASQIDRNIGEFFKDRVVLDCFAGSGAVGIEALSRGAKHAYFVDINQDATETIRNNIKKLGTAADSATIICSDISKIRKCSQEKCDFIFLDPPFATEIKASKILEYLIQKCWIEENAVVVIESLANKFTKHDSITEGFYEFKKLMCREVGRIKFEILTRSHF